MFWISGRRLATSFTSLEIKAINVAFPDGAAVTVYGDRCAALLIRQLHETRCSLSSLSSYGRVSFHNASGLRGIDSGDGHESVLLSEYDLLS